MKKILVCLLLFTGGLVQAQELFINAWELSIDSTLALLPDSSRTKYDSLAQGIRTSAQEAMDGRVFDINSDSTIVIHWKAKGIHKTSEGSWQYSAEHHKLMFLVDGKKTYFTIVALSANLLILEQADRGVMFRKLYFKPAEE